MPVIPDKVYKFLKWMIGIVLPAALTFFGICGHTLDWPCTATVLTIGAGFVAFLGTITGISTVAYNANKKIEDLVSEIESKEL